MADIVLALCMEHGVSQRLSRIHRPNARNVNTLAGRLMALPPPLSVDSSFLGKSRLMESPGLSTLQRHLHCCIYQSTASFMNIVYHACSQPVRMAYMLGLRLEQSRSQPEKFYMTLNSNRYFCSRLRCCSKTPLSSNMKFAAHHSI